VFRRRQKRRSQKNRLFPRQPLKSDRYHRCYDHQQLACVVVMDHATSEKRLRRLQRRQPCNLHQRYRLNKNSLLRWKRFSPRSNRYPRSRSRR
jgi:hypothetical protein